MTPIEQAREAAAKLLDTEESWSNAFVAAVRAGTEDDCEFVQSHLRAILAAYRRCAEITKGHSNDIESGVFNKGYVFACEEIEAEIRKEAGI